MLAIGFDPNITISGVLVAIPATIAAIAALKSNKQGKALHKELASPNGTTTAVAIQDIKTQLGTILVNQANHELVDQVRFGDINKRIDAIDTRDATVRKDLIKNRK